MHDIIRNILVGFIFVTWFWKKKVIVFIFIFMFLMSFDVYVLLHALYYQDKPRVKLCISHSVYWCTNMHGSRKCTLIIAHFQFELWVYLNCCSATVNENAKCSVLISDQLYIGLPCSHFQFINYDVSCVWKCFNNHKTSQWHANNVWLYHITS